MDKGTSVQNGTVDIFPLTFIDIWKASWCEILDLKYSSLKVMMLEFFGSIAPSIDNIFFLSIGQVLITSRVGIV